MGIKGTGSKPTLVSLARELGVSRQTVSNVINAPELVRPETRERVQAAIERSGYRPSALGRALRTNRSMNLAYRIHPMTDDINGTVMDRFLHALTNAAQTSSYRVTLFTAHDDEQEFGELESLASINAIDGCVLINTGSGDTRPERLLGLGCPFVAFGRPWDALPGRHAWVDIEGASGTRAATEMLLERGHRNIAFLGWEAGSGTGDDRRAGWAAAMTGVVDHPERLDIGIRNDGVTAGAEAARELRARGATAVVCASDSLALGAFPSFAEPGQAFVPVVGFDDTPVARALGVSSCAQPVEQAARFCIKTLITLLKKPDADPSAHQRLLSPVLTVRERALS